MSAAKVQMNAMVPKELRQRARIAFAIEGITHQEWYNLQLKRWLEEREKKEREASA